MRRRGQSKGAKRSPADAQRESDGRLKKRQQLAKSFNFNQENMSAGTLRSNASHPSAALPPQLCAPASPRGAPAMATLCEAATTLETPTHHLSYAGITASSPPSNPMDATCLSWLASQQLQSQQLQATVANQGLLPRGLSTQAAPTAVALDVPQFALQHMLQSNNLAAVEPQQHQLGAPAVLTLPILCQSVGASPHTVPAQTHVAATEGAAVCGHLGSSGTPAVTQSSAGTPGTLLPLSVPLSTAAQSAPLSMALGAANAAALFNLPQIGCVPPMTSRPSSVQKQQEILAQTVPMLLPAAPGLPRPWQHDLQPHMLQAVSQPAVSMHSLQHVHLQQQQSATFPAHAGSVAQLLAGMQALQQPVVGVAGPAFRRLREFGWPNPVQNPVHQLHHTDTGSTEQQQQQQRMSDVRVAANALAATHLMHARIAAAQQLAQIPAAVPCFVPLNACGISVSQSLRTVLTVPRNAEAGLQTPTATAAACAAPHRWAAGDANERLLASSSVMPVLSNANPQTPPQQALQLPVIATQSVPSLRLNTSAASTCVENACAVNAALCDQGRAWDALNLQRLPPSVAQVLVHTLSNGAVGAPPAVAPLTVAAAAPQLPAAAAMPAAAAAAAAAMAVAAGTVAAAPLLAHLTRHFMAAAAQGRSATPPAPASRNCANEVAACHPLHVPVGGFSGGDVEEYCRDNYASLKSVGEQDPATSEETVESEEHVASEVHTVSTSPTKQR